MYHTTLSSTTNEPPPRFSSACTYYENKLFMFGGVDITSNEKMKNDFYSYDLILKIWNRLTPKFTPHSRLGHTLVTDNESGLLYLVGGNEQKKKN